MKTIKDAAKEAVLVQDACNLIPIVRSFQKALEIIAKTPEAREKGTDYIINHPISILFASKIESLVHPDLAFSKAYQSCILLGEWE